MASGAKEKVTPKEETPKPMHAADARYSCDESRLQNIRSRAPWKDEPKYFRKVAVSPSATTKMMMHCHSGVESGIAKGGKPTEKMGLLLGRPDPETPRTLIVTDVFPLPIEGFETRVVADDQDVVNHMIALGESMERTRKEKFMGWYHSHPFDVGSCSHCYLSQTDISTQLQWQRAEDPHGNPWLAIVIDPLRSLAKNVPELKAFRVYPPGYKSPILNECPDGTVLKEEQLRLEKWGICWNRYYELEVEYFMSASARNVMAILSQKFSWIRTLGTTTMLDEETKERYPERLTTIAQKIEAIDVNLKSSSGAFPGAQHSPHAAGAGQLECDKKDEGDLEKATSALAGLAMEKLHGNAIQLAKKDLFH